MIDNSKTYSLGCINIGVSRGGGVQGVLSPLFLDPPLFICDPKPDLTDKCNVNCFLIVYYAV